MSLQRGLEPWCAIHEKQCVGNAVFLAEFKEKYLREFRHLIWRGGYKGRGSLRDRRRIARTPRRRLKSPFRPARSDSISYRCLAVNRLSDLIVDDFPTAIDTEIPNFKNSIWE